MYPHLRFESKVKKLNSKECWEWIGAKKASGAGLFVVKTWPIEDRRCMSARKYAYQFYKGPVPKDMYVQADCGNQKCVNPYHLILKSRGQVIQESIKAGRWAHDGICNLPPPKCGELNGNCKVSDSTVVKIREERRKGTKLIVLSLRFGTSISNVSVICRKETRRGCGDL